MLIKRFEDIDAWKEARRLVNSEVQSELYVGLDRGYITKEEFEGIYGQAQSVRKLANGFIRYLRTGKPANPLTR